MVIWAIEIVFMEVFSWKCSRAHGNVLMAGQSDSYIEIQIEIQTEIQIEIQIEIQKIQSQSQIQIQIQSQI